MKRYVIAVVVAMAAAACGGGEPEAEKTKAPASFAPGSTMATIKASGKLRVGVKIDIPNFGYLNPTTGKHEGFDVDMATEVAKTLGVQPEFTEALSANRIPYLKENKVDIVFSTMTVTEQRKQEIDFSDVYYVASQDFLTKKGRKLSAATAAGKTVCTAKGSTSETNLPKLQPQVKITLQDGYAQCVQLVRNDQADAVSTDDVILLQFVQQDSKTFELSRNPFSREPYGAGITKGRSDFVTFVNTVIRDMKEDGRWGRIYKKWIGKVTGETADPPQADVTFEIIGLSPSPGTAATPGTTGSPGAASTPRVRTPVPQTPSPR